MCWSEAWEKERKEKRARLWWKKGTVLFFQQSKIQWLGNRRGSIFFFPHRPRGFWQFRAFFAPKLRVALTCRVHAVAWSLGRFSFFHSYPFHRHVRLQLIHACTLIPSFSSTLLSNFPCIDGPSCMCFFLQLMCTLIYTSCPCPVNSLAHTFNSITTWNRMFI